MIKSVLIKKYSEEYIREKKMNLRNKLAILEVGCGKGGDLIKWNKNNMGRYVGLDISRVSLM